MREFTEQEQVRRDKLNNLVNLGIDPFGQRFERTSFAKDIKEKYKDIEHDEFDNREDIEIVAGRIMFIRKMGKASFFTIKDKTGNIQIYISINDVGEDIYYLFKSADIGDIVGINSVKKIKETIPKYKEQNNIDFIIANGENSADGMGITFKIYEDLKNSKIDMITMGNHTWGKKEIFNFINDEKIIRPANYPANVAGVGYKIQECNGKKIAIINLIGRVEMPVLSENPFLKADEIVNKIRDNADIIIVDFHAEATAEKIAMGYYLDGRVTCVFGTHTHVQTADETILEKGTGYITDVGMTGPKKSVIGMEVANSIKRFVTTLPERYKVSDDKKIELSGCLLEINDKNCRIEKIKRIKL